MIFFKKFGAEISFDGANFAFTNVNVTYRAYSESRRDHRGPTVFLKDKDGRSLKFCQQELGYTGEWRSNNPRQVSWLLKATENVAVPPRYRQILRGRLEAEGKQRPPSLVVEQPAHIPIAGILPSRGLSRTDARAQVPLGMTSLDNHAETSARYAYVIVANFTEEKLTIGVAEYFREQAIDRLNTVSRADAARLELSRTQKRNEVLYRKLLQGKL